MHRARHGPEPRIAGAARRASWVWLNDAPLYYWVALAFGKLFQTSSSPFRGAARERRVRARACWLLYRAARDWTPRRIAAPPRRRRSPFHRLGPDLIVHATRRCRARHPRRAERRTRRACRGQRRGLSHRRPVRCRAWPRFLSSTWIAPAALGLAVVAAHLACPEWRGRNALPFLAASLIVGGVLAISWPPWRFTAVRPSSFKIGGL